MKKLFLLLFCLFIFQLQVLAYNNMQLKYEKNNEFVALKQKAQEYSDKYGKDFMLIIILNYKDDESHQNFIDKVYNEFNKTDASSTGKQYISCYYLAKLFFKVSDYTTNENNFDEIIIIDDREWKLLSENTKTLITIYNVLAKINNNSQNIINNSKQKQLEAENTAVVKKLKKAIKEFGKDFVIRSQCKISKIDGYDSIMEYVNKEYIKWDKEQEKSYTSLYYLKIIKMNLNDYKKNLEPLKPIIIDNNEWDSLSTATKNAVTLYNLLAKECNE